MWSALAPDEPRHVPGADAEAVRAHEQPALGLGAARLGEQPAEVGVGLEQWDLFGPHACARCRGGGTAWCGNWSSPGGGVRGWNGRVQVRAGWRRRTVPAGLRCVGSGSAADASALLAYPAGRQVMRPAGKRVASVDEAGAVDARW